jgi:alanine dehydrogenase
VLVLSDASNGAPLAVMDSMALTALRTAAATAVAAKHLARQRSASVLICGCGGQANAQLTALRRVRRLERIVVFDQDARKAAAFAASSRVAFGTDIVPAEDLASAVAAADIIVTCTTSERFFVEHGMVRPGTFISAVGADNERKQEIDPRLLAASTVVTDITAQCCAIGDLHHAVAQGVMSPNDVHAELGEIVAGLKAGRTRDDEIVIFDSSGTALQDVAAAAAVYRRAIDCGEGVQFSFDGLRTGLFPAN